MSKPHAGDKLHCQSCGLEIQVIKDCTCDESSMELKCCGKPLEQVSQ